MEPVPEQPPVVPAAEQPHVIPAAPRGRGNVRGRGRGAIRGRGQGQGRRRGQGAEVVPQAEIPQDEQMSVNQEEEIGGVEPEVVQGEENVHASQEVLPDPPANDLVAVMANQTRLMEALAQGINNRGGGQGYHSKMIEFMRLRPATFDHTDEDPLVDDDWLRAISKKLEVVNANDQEKVILASHQLTGAAGEWWDNYQDSTENPAAITWAEFQEEFRKYHIPEGIMEMKADEFRSLRQGAMIANQYIRKFMKLARYAPEDVDTDKKKQDKFRKELSNHLKAQLVTHIYPDFNTLMNRTILLEDARSHIESERKRKFFTQKSKQQERLQKFRFNPAPRPGSMQKSGPSQKPAYQQTMQYRVSGSNTQAPALSYRS